MFSKEESAKLRISFWTSFGKSFPQKWLLYNTKIKGFSFKFVATTKQAMVCLDIEPKNEELKEHYYIFFIFLASFSAFLRAFSAFFNCFSVFLASFSVFLACFTVFLACFFTESACLSALSSALADVLASFLASLISLFFS